MEVHERKLAIYQGQENAKDGASTHAASQLKWAVGVLQTKYGRSV